MVPVHDGASSLRELHIRLGRVLSTEGGGEMIFVDDASGDGSWDLLAALAKADGRVRALRLAVNCGQHQATLCGLRLARSPFAVTLDDDLQHPPEEIPKLRAVADQGYWVVMGAGDGAGHPASRRLASRVSEWLHRLVLAKPSGLRMTSFRLLSREALDLLLREPRPVAPYLAGEILRRVPRERIANAGVAHRPRASGRSGYGALRLAGLAGRLSLRYSVLAPLAGRLLPLPRQPVIRESVGLEASP